MTSGWLLWKTSYIVCSKSVEGPVQGCPRPNPNGEIELFQVSLMGFQKFFLFRVAGMILEDWELELEWVHSFSI